MNLFEKFVYQLIKDEVSPHPAPADCPAIKAERNGETSQEVVRICLNCFENLKKQKEKPMTTFEEKIYPILKIKPAVHPDSKDCPAIKAEQDGKSVAEIIDICRTCYAKLIEPKHSK